MGPTADAVRRIQVEGPSGIIATGSPWCRPDYQPSTRTIRWPNGAVAHLFSGEEADRLRGPNLDFAWVDELCSFQNGDAVMDMLQMALRVQGPHGHAPRMLISTTPKPNPLLLSILRASDTVTTKSKTSDNAAHLDASTLKYYRQKYAGTTLGRQELDAEVLQDLEGALWNRGMLDACRVDEAPELGRLVVAIDPSGGGSGECGIVLVGKTRNNHTYLLQDASGKMSPERWARRAVDLYRIHKADAIIAEQNFGGAMVEGTIRTVDQSANVKLVIASRGKAVRAEPVVALYEQRRCHHVGQYPLLEDQLCTWDPDGSGASPDRLDALVWAITDLVIDNKAVNLEVWDKAFNENEGIMRAMAIYGGGIR